MRTYNPALVERARTLRKEMTPAEKHLWMYCLQGAPYRFRRQRPVGSYIVDFYCGKLKLVIEVDGDNHFSEESIAYDKERTKFLESLGLRVLRFSNHEVLYELESVKEKIYTFIK